MPSGYVSNSTDCNDSDANMNATYSFYADTDADGYGAGVLVSLCAVNSTTPPSGYVTNNTDCDDNNISVWQSKTLYTDADGDTYTVGAGTITCYGATLPAGTTLTQNGTDCNDNNISLWQSNTLYTDADGDTYTVGVGIITCYGATLPAGTTLTQNGTDCNDNVYSLTNSCGGGSVVNLTMFVQGYYSGDSTMVSVKLNQWDGVSAEPSATDVEDMTVELHDAVDYSLVYTAVGTLQTDGTLSVTFNTAAAGDYYIAVKGSNLVQTWSAEPQTVGAVALSYDFSSAASQAYGDNMIEMESGVFAMYQGELVVDDLVDTQDYTTWEGSYLNGDFGAQPSDLNGDGLVDTADYPIWEGNYLLGVFAAYPF